MRLKSYRRIVDFQKIAAKKGLVPRAAKKPIGEQKYSTNSQNTIFFVFGPKLCIWERERSKNTKKQIFLQNVFGNMIFGSQQNICNISEKKAATKVWKEKFLVKIHMCMHFHIYLKQTHFSKKEFFIVIFGWHFQGGSETRRVEEGLRKKSAAEETASMRGLRCFCAHPLCSYRVLYL